jgi:hypothetical protein
MGWGASATWLPPSGDEALSQVLALGMNTFALVALGAGNSLILLADSEKYSSTNKVAEVRHRCS